MIVFRGADRDVCFEFFEEGAEFRVGEFIASKLARCRCGSGRFGGGRLCLRGLSGLRVDL